MQVFYFILLVRRALPCVNFLRWNHETFSAETESSPNIIRYMNIRPTMLKDYGEIKRSAGDCVAWRVNLLLKKMTHDDDDE